LWHHRTHTLPWFPTRRSSDPELRGLPDHDRPGPDHHRGPDVRALRHLPPPDPRDELGEEVRVVVRARVRLRVVLYGKNRHLLVRSEEHTSELQSRDHIVCPTQ